MTDAGMLEKVLSHIHNWFVRESWTAKGCAIEGGELPASVSSLMLDGQWYRIEGSYLNDGLHQNPASDLEDETFDGTISLLAIPKPLLSIVDEISDWIEDTEQADREARKAKFQSESFGGYSYSLKADSRSNSASGGLTGWQAAFRSDLNPWRKPY